MYTCRYTYIYTSEVRALRARRAQFVSPTVGGGGGYLTWNIHFRIPPLNRNHPSYRFLRISNIRGCIQNMFAPPYSRTPTCDSKTRSCYEIGVGQTGLGSQDPDLCKHLYRVSASYS